MKDKETSKKRQCKSWATKGRADYFVQDFYLNCSFSCIMTVTMHSSRYAPGRKHLIFPVHFVFFFQVLLWDHIGEPSLLWISLEGQILFTISSSLFCADCQFCQLIPVEVHNKFLPVLLLKTFFSFFAQKAQYKNQTVFNVGIEKHKVA